MMAEGPAYILDLKALTRGDLTLADLPPLEAELYGGSDRASAVLIGSVVEAGLTSLLKGALRSNLRSEDRRLLFDFDGPLGTFPSKTALAYAMGLIGPITRSDLDIIRLLRNEFAHSRRHFKFNTPQVAAVCARLKTPETPGFSIPYGYLSAAAEHRLEDAGRHYQTKDPVYR